tara:strand:- start:469 stop:624 length:156 start_codon:yes stop_codon:yes gene_type:complete
MAESVDRQGLAGGLSFAEDWANAKPEQRVAVRQIRVMSVFKEVAFSIIAIC